jgi:hypothetical protein
MRDVLAAKIIGAGAGAIVPWLGDYVELRGREQWYESDAYANGSSRVAGMLRSAAYRDAGPDCHADTERIANENTVFNQDADAISDAVLFASCNLNTAGHRRRSATQRAGNFHAAVEAGAAIVS